MTVAKEVIESFQVRRGLELEPTALAMSSAGQQKKWRFLLSFDPGPTRSGSGLWSVCIDQSLFSVHTLFARALFVVRQLRDRRRPTAGAPGLRRPLRKASVPSFAGGDRPSTGMLTLSLPAPLCETGHLNPNLIYFAICIRIWSSYERIQFLCVCVCAPKKKVTWRKSTLHRYPLPGLSTPQWRSQP